jgi:hypothetical protein
VSAAGCPAQPAAACVFGYHRQKLRAGPCCIQLGLRWSDPLLPLPTSLIPALRDNIAGQLGCGAACGTMSAVPVAVSGNHRFKQISAAPYYTCALALNGTALCW